MQEFVPPGSDEYKVAFAAIRDGLTDNQLRMLRAHYHSGGRAITVRELATTMGYDDFNQGNLQYGSLAKKLLRAMGRDARVKIMVFGELVSRREFGLEMHIVMHFGNWDISTLPILGLSLGCLTMTAHVNNGGESGNDNCPRLQTQFSGGNITLEALARADAFASEPKYGFDVF
ncbi:MAG: hypothetical protein IPK01_13960 [Acidobacteria bacterium]|nr:hypothetical protein [Acidobacteriota bacterium]